MHDEGSFLAKACEMRVQSTRSILRIRSDHAPIFTKKRFYLCCVCFPRSSKASLLLPCAPRTCFALDETTNDLPCARYIRRSDQRQSRTAGGKRAVATPTDHSASTNQTTSIPEDGPTSPGAPRQDGSNLETGAFPRPAGDGSLRWHRELFRLFWKHKSKAHARKPRLSPETISLIKEMAANNRLWGAERIRGELLKLDIRSKSNGPSRSI